MFWLLRKYLQSKINQLAQGSVFLSFQKVFIYSMRV